MDDLWDILDGFIGAKTMEEAISKIENYHGHIFS
jgi:hypothetical protein